MMTSFTAAARRFALAFALGLVAELIHVPLAATSVSSKLEPWALASFVAGTLFGPAGIFGVPVAYCVINLASGGDPKHLGAMAVAYLALSTTSYATFRFGKGLRRALSNLRSYVAFFGAALIGSLPLALIGSSQLFLKQFGVSAFWSGVAYWFSSSATTILLVGPLLILGLGSVLPSWAVRPPGQRGIVDTTGKPGAPERKDLLRIAAMVSAATLIALPLSNSWPLFGSWLLLLYLVPTLWASTHLGMQVALVTASASGLAYLVGADLGAMISSRPATHESVMNDCAGLVMIAVIGAVTGAFQKKRLGAERELLASKSELETRNNSLELANRLADSLHRSLSLREIAVETTAALKTLTDSPLIGFYILDDAGEHLNLIAQQGFDEEALQLASRVPLRGSANGLAVETGKMLVSENPGTDLRLLPEIRKALQKRRLSTVVAIPVIFEGRTLGTIDLAYGQRKKLHSEDLAPLQAIGKTVALALVNAQRLLERERLEEAREELVIEVKAKNVELEAQNAELERYAYTVSHDLKSPLLTIRGFVGLVRRDAEAGDLERMEEDLQRIEAASERMKRLLEDLLELSRTGRLINEPKVVSLDSVVHDAVDWMDGTIRANGVEVEIVSPMPQAFADRQRLLDVFKNLCENAIRFMGDQRNPRLEIGARQEGKDVLCYVRDNGIGIEPRYHERIFRLFERLGSGPEGTGIGLALAKRIVEVHGGRIWVESEGLGHGSTFWFTLPQHAAQTNSEITAKNDTGAAGVPREN